MLCVNIFLSGSDKRRVVSFDPHTQEEEQGRVIYLRHSIYKLASLRVLEPLLFIVITNTSERFIVSNREFAFLLQIRTPSL
jgi:hypothetical protein